MRRTTLSDDDQWAIINALRGRAEDCDTHARRCLPDSRARDSWTKNAVDTRILANRIEDAANVCVDVE